MKKFSWALISERNSEVLFLCRYERRKSQMMASIEDEAAEAAELMARRGSHSVVRNGHEFERRMSKVSRKSARSSVGGGSNNGSYQGALGTTTAEVILGVQGSFDSKKLWKNSFNHIGQTLFRNACKNEKKFSSIQSLFRHPVVKINFVKYTVFAIHQIRSHLNYQKMTFRCQKSSKQIPNTHATSLTCTLIFRFLML